MIVTFFEVEVSAWSNSKFCAYACEWWHVMVIIYLAESWVIWKNWFTLNSTHLKKNLFDCEVDVKHQKCLDLFWTLLRTSRDIPQPIVVHHCEVELLRPVAYIWPSEPFLWFCTWGVLCEYSSEFYIEVLIWGNKDLYLFIQAADRILIKWNCGKPPRTSFFPMWLAP